MDPRYLDNILSPTASDAMISKHVLTITVTLLAGIAVIGYVTVMTIFR